MKVWFLLAQAEYVAYPFVKPYFKTVLYRFYKQNVLKLWVEIKNQKLSKLLWISLSHQSNVAKKDVKMNKLSNFRMRENLILVLKTSSWSTPGSWAEIAG